MRKLKRSLSFMLAVVMMISMSGMSVMAAEQQETREGCVEISLDDVASTYASNYYSRGLVVLNIATAGVSNECRITSGSVPDGATISRVELKGTKSTGSGTVYWYVEHEATGRVASARFASPATITSFNGLTADSAWIIWIEGDAWSTVRNGSIKVYYTY